MADEDIGGIKIGLTADTKQLKTALSEANALISGEAQKLRDRKITMNVYAKVDSTTFNKIKSDLDLVVKKAQEKNKFKFTPVFEINQATIRLGQRQLRQQAKQAGGIKIPVVPEFDPAVMAKAMEGQTVAVPVVGEWKGWAADRMPEDFVLVKGIWDGWQGEGPPTASGGPSGGSGGAPRSGAPRTGGRPASREPEAEPQAAQAEPETKKQSRARSTARETGKAVAEEIKEEPVKTETAPKEKAENKTAASKPASKPAAAPKAGPAPRELQHASAEEMIAANPNMSEATLRQSWAARINEGWVPKGAGAPSAREPVRASAPVEGGKAASRAAAKTAEKAVSEKDIEAEIKASQKAQDDAIDVAMSNIEASAIRMEEVRGPSPRPEVGENQVLCPWCHNPYSKRGLTAHMRNKHADEMGGATPGGYDREELARARENQRTGGIGEVTPESTLLRRMAEERQEIGIYDLGPDMERLLGTIERDKFGRAKMATVNGASRPIRQGGLLRKGLDPTAMRQGLLQPLQDLPEEKQQALLQDPDFIALKTEFYEAVEARRAGLKAAFAEELTKVAENPQRSERYLNTLREAIEDPTAGIAHDIGRRVGRQERRAQLGISDEALTGFSARDVLTALPVEAGDRPPEFQGLLETYLKSEMERAEAEAANVKELDAALVKHRTGEPGARKWDFGPDIEEIRQLRERAFTMPDRGDFEGWVSHAVGRGANPEAIAALRAEVEATPVGERGDLMADKIEELRAEFGSPDPRALEEIQRLASGPRYGEDISGFEEGDSRRTGLLSRIRRGIVKGASTPEAAIRRLQALTDPNQRRTLKTLRPQEVELLEVAGYAAEAAAELDIIDARRNQVQSTGQAQDTRASNAANPRKAAKTTRRRVRGTKDELDALEAERDARIAERKEHIDPEISEARRRAALEQAQRDTAEFDRQARAREVEATPPDLGDKDVILAASGEAPKPRHNDPVMSSIVDVGETDVTELSPEDRAALASAEATPAQLSHVQRRCTSCGWTGTDEYFKSHFGGRQHQLWLQSRNAPGPSRGFAHGPYNPEVTSAAEQREATITALTGISPVADPYAGLRATPPTTRNFASSGASENIGVQESGVPSATVAGQEPTPTSTTRWCPICKRPISTRGGAWASHIKGRDHKMMMAHATERMRQGYQDVGSALPPDFEEVFRRTNEEAVVMPPPVMGMAASGSELSPEDLKELRKIAATEGGRKSLLSATPPWTPAQIEEILGAESARGGGGGGGGRPSGADMPEDEGQPRRRAILGRGGVATAVGQENFASTIRQQRKEWSGVFDIIQDQKNFAREVLEENPVRALSVAIGQVLVNLTGRADLKNTVGDIGRTASEVDALAKEAKEVRERWTAAWEGLASPNLDEETRERLQQVEEELGGKAEDGKRAGEGGVFGEISGQFEEAAGVSLARFEEIGKLKPRERRQAIRELEQEALAREEAAGLGEEDAPETLMAQAARLRKARPGIAIRTAVNATVGIVGGTALFTAAMAAFNAAMEHGTAWVGRMTDEMSGFATQANVLATSLGQGAMATGRTEGGIRERLGMAGIGGAAADQLVDTISPRITGEVAAQRAVAMRDTLALGFQSMMAQARQPGIENFMGNFQPTGGMVLPLIGQTDIGAQASVQQTIAGMVGGLPSNMMFDAINGQGWQQSQNLRGIRDFFTGGAASREMEATEEYANMVTGTLTDALRKGGNQNQFANAALAGIDDFEGLQKQAMALIAKGGSPELADRIKSGDIALVDAQGNLITNADEVAAAFDDLATGLKSVDLAQILKSGARSMEAAFFGIAQNLQNQIQTWNPIQNAMQLGANPLAPFGAGVNLGAAGIPFVAGRVGPNLAMRGELEARAARGRSELESLLDVAPAVGRVRRREPGTSTSRGAGVDGQSTLALFDRINSLGDTMVGWQTDIAEMQLGQQMVEYNRQVFVAKRNIDDLRGLVHGVGDAQASNLGIMQRENLMRQRRIQDIQREGEAASLAMNQRQINFQSAQANFSAFGSTPAQVAAQIEQQRREAQFAQEQQNRNVAVFDITGEMIPTERDIIDEQNLRALEDALAEFQIFTDRFELDQKVKLMADDMAVAQQLQAMLMADLQASVGALQQAQGVEVQMIQDAYTRGSETLNQTATEVKRVYEEVANSFARSFDITISGTRTSSGTQYTSGGVGYQGDPKKATGWLGNVSGATSMTVGEAGMETVAILRNPRKMNMGGGGGSIQININNPVVRDEADVNALARAVEQVLNRRSALMGLR